jgi:NAD(P)H dehydrogenase (quinone)
MNSRTLTLRLVLLLLALPALRTVPAAENDSADHGDRIIISGASGQLGTLTVKALLARGVPAGRLILVSRTPEKLQGFAKLGAATRYADFAKPESLPGAYAGGTRMLLISIGGGAGPRPDAHRRAIEAAIAAGVKHIAYTSYVGVSGGETTGLAGDHFQTEQILKQSGVGWTMLRNSIYMQGVLPQAARMVAAGRADLRPGESKIGYVTREDCAEAAAAVLTTPGHDGKAYDITGPELVGTREIAAAASAVSGKPIEVVTADASAAGRSFGGPALSVTSTAVLDLTGRPPTSVRRFLETHKDQLLGASP